LLSLTFSNVVMPFSERSFVTPRSCPFGQSAMMGRSAVGSCGDSAQVL
jgi:hypothetical protein